MKEFEKWYNELPMREDVEDFTLATQAKYKKGWRAALELVFGWLDYSTEHEEIKDKICKELE